MKQRPSSFNAPIILEQSCDLLYFCEFEITSAYLLEGFEREMLHERLMAMGDRFYYFPFVYRAGYEAKTAFLQISEAHLFMLPGVQAQLDLRRYSSSENLARFTPAPGKRRAASASSGSPAKA